MIITMIVGHTNMSMMAILVSMCEYQSDTHSMKPYQEAMYTRQDMMYMK